MAKAENIITDSVIENVEDAARDNLITAITDAPGKDTTPTGIRGTIAKADADWLTECAKRTKLDQGVILEAALVTLRGLPKDELQAILSEVIVSRMFN